jgi:hypothetical protein
MIVNDHSDEIIIGMIETSYGMHSFSLKKTTSSMRNINTSFSSSSSSISAAAVQLDLNTLSLDTDLSDILSYESDKTVIYRRLSQSKSLSSAKVFADELQTLTDEIISKYHKEILSNRRFNKTASAIPLIVTQQLEELGWKHVEKVSVEMTTIKVKLLDSANRSHIVDITIPSDFPVTAPLVQASLPEKIEDHQQWKPGQSSLMSIYRIAETIIRQNQMIIDVLADFDSNTWVLEPVQPSFAVLTRRVAIDTSSSIMITVDPANAYAVSQEL